MKLNSSTFNMKYCVLAIALVLCVYISSTAGSVLPVPLSFEDAVVQLPGDEDHFSSVDDVTDIRPAEEEPTRHKRATCDLLSFTGANHSACAAHCILKRFRGGYCNGKAVCVCRR